MSKTEIRPRWYIKLIGSLLLTILSAGVLEIASCSYLMRFEGYDGRHMMNYQFDDYKNILPTPDYVDTRGVYHNAQGFRRKGEVAQKKPKGTYRIFLMGGSAAYGTGSLAAFGKDKWPILRNDETIDYFLEAFLKEKLPGRSIEVINAGITSHQSHHHLIYLNQTILKMHPDMVIFFDGFNDYYSYTKDFDQFRDYAYQERVHKFMDEPTVGAWTGYTGWWLFRKSHFVHLSTTLLRPLWIKAVSGGGIRAKIDVDEGINNLKENAKLNFLKMVERNTLILKAEGVVPVFALQPEIFFEQNKRLSPLELKIFEWLSTQWQENLVEFKRRAKPVVVDGLQRTTSKNGAIFVDLTDPFGGIEGDVYTDYCHLTPTGNKRIAEVLGQKLLPMIIQGRDVVSAGAAVSSNSAGVPHLEGWG